MRAQGDARQRIILPLSTYPRHVAPPKTGADGLLDDLEHPWLIDEEAAGPSRYVAVGGRQCLRIRRQLFDLLDDRRRFLRPNRVRPHHEASDIEFISLGWCQLVPRPPTPPGFENWMVIG